MGHPRHFPEQEKLFDSLKALKHFSGAKKGLFKPSVVWKAFWKDLYNLQKCLNLHALTDLFIVMFFVLVKQHLGEMFWI